MNSNYWKINGTRVEPASSWDIQIPEGKALTSDSVKQLDTLGPDQFVDGGVNDWENTLTSFDITNTFDWTTVVAPGARITESDVVDFGTKSAKMETVESFSNEGPVISRPVLFLNGVTQPNNDVNIGARMKGAVGGEKVALTAINGDPENFTKVLNLDTNTWDSETNLDTILANDNYKDVRTLTTDWVSYFSGSFDYDVTQKVSLILSIDDETAGKIVYVNYNWVSTDGEEQTAYRPDEWFAVGSNLNIPIPSSVSESDSASVKFQGDEMNPSAMYTGVEGLTPLDAYVGTFRAKSDSGTSQFGVLYQAGDTIGGMYLFYKTGPFAGTWVLDNPILNLNYSFENWTLGEPDNWTSFDLVAGGSISEDNVKFNTGAASLKFTCAGGGAKGIKQTLTGLDSDWEYRLSMFIAGAGAGTETAAFINLNGDESEVWNRDTSSWDVWTGSPTDPGQVYTIYFESTTAFVQRDFLVKTDDAGEITIVIAATPGTTDVWNLDDLTIRSDSFEPSEDAIESFTTTSSWATYTTASPQVTVPPVGGLYPILISLTNDVYLDGATLKKDGTGANVLPNPNFVNWVIGGLASDGSFEDNFAAKNILTDWTVFLQGKVEAEDTVKTEGAYSAKFTLEGQDGGLIVQLITGKTPGDIYRLSFDAKYLTDASKFSVIAFNNNFLATTKIYDPDTETWVDPSEGIPEKEFLITDTFATYTYDIPVPASGNILLAVSHGKVSTDDVVAYLDNLKFQKFEPSAPVALFPFENDSDGADLGASDTVFEFKTTGGTEKNHLSLDGTGAFQTDNSFFDWRAKPSAVQNINTGVGHAFISPVNGGATLLKMSSVPVDFMEKGQYDLYTVPIGYSFVIPPGGASNTSTQQFPILRLTGSAGSAPVINIGADSTYSDWTWGYNQLAYNGPYNRPIPLWTRQAPGTEDWIENNALTDWTGPALDHWTTASINGGALAKETIIVQGFGGASAKITCTSNGDGYVLTAPIREHTVGTTWSNTFYDYKDAGSSANAKTMKFYLNGPWGAATEQYNFFNEEWQVIVGSPTLSGNFVIEYSPQGGNWTQRNTGFGGETVTTPGTGELYLGLYATGDAGDLIYLDTIATNSYHLTNVAKTYTSGQTIKLTVTEAAAGGGGNNLEGVVDMWGYLIQE